MSKGKKRLTPKKFWTKIGKVKLPWYSKQSWRKTSPHVVGKNHNKDKWYFRGKKWFKQFDGKHLSMTKMKAIELWYWD